MNIWDKYYFDVQEYFFTQNTPSNCKDFCKLL